MYKRQEQGNVIKLEHNQFVSINRNAAVELRITVEAFGTDHKNKICLLYTSGRGIGRTKKSAEQRAAYRGILTIRKPQE